MLLLLHFCFNMSCWQNTQLCCGACRICLYTVFMSFLYWITYCSESLIIRVLKFLCKINELCLVTKISYCICHLSELRQPSSLSMMILYTYMYGLYRQSICFSDASLSLLTFVLLLETVLTCQWETSANWFTLYLSDWSQVFQLGSWTLSSGHHCYVPHFGVFVRWQITAVIGFISLRSLY